MTHVSALPVLLLTDDEPPVLHSASLVLRTSGIAHVITVDDSRAVLPLLAEQEVGVLVLDLTMPHISGQALMEQVAGDYPDIPIILMTATNDLETAVQCMRTGAVDYLVKPVEENRLVSSVKRALEIRMLRAEVLSLKDRLLTDTPPRWEAFAEIITQSRAMLAIFRYKDLYYRLRTHHLHLPPLRARTGDLPLLVQSFVDKAACVLGKEAPTVPLALYQLLNTYSFPGNVRELEALVFDAVARHQGVVMSLHSFKEALGDTPHVAVAEPPAEPPAALMASFPERLPTLKEAEEALSEALITEALRRADGNQGVAAGLLGISRQALNQRLRRRQQPEPSATLAE
jgi:DNA-binding NtrC family response regulator